MRRCNQASGRPSERGVTLVELMIVLALLAMLVSLAMPNFQSAIQNAQIRTTAESVLNGLQRARSEAILRNRQVRLRLTNTSNAQAQAGGADWQIHSLDNNTPQAFTELVESRNGMEDTGNTRLGVRTVEEYSTAAAPGAGMPADIVFNGMGRLASGTTARQIDIVHARAAGGRRLAIAISTGGDIRLCNPELRVSESLQGCL